MRILKNSQRVNLNGHRRVQISNMRAQFKIQQMAFVLMAIFVFFVLVGLFLISMQSRNLNKNAQEIKDEKALKALQSLVDSAELSCGVGVMNCIDADKAMVLKESRAYQNYWDLSGAYLVTIYPRYDEAIECTSTNYPNCNLIRIFGEVAGSCPGNFVALCRKESVNGNVYDNCNLAKIVVCPKEIIVQ